MGLFMPKPYRVHGLSGREKAAVGTALEIGIQCSSGSVVGKLKTARRDFNNGALSVGDMVAALACIEALICAVSDRGEDGMLSESELADTLRPVEEKLRAML